MTGLVSLFSENQNYVIFDLYDSIIVRVRPSLYKGWIGTEVLSYSFQPGDYLRIQLQWKDYDFNLQYSIWNAVPGGSIGIHWLFDWADPHPNLYVSPATGIEHEAYRIEYAGLPLYFDTVSDATEKAAMALIYAGKLISPLLAYVDGIQLVDEPKPDKPDVIADIHDGLMTIFGGRSIDYTVVAHEASHAFAISKWGSAAPPDNSDYMAAINSAESPVSEYSRTSPGEDFAEAVQLYATDPAYCRNIAPIRFNVINKLMTDPDYGG